MKFNTWYFKFLLILVFSLAVYSSFYLYNYKKKELNQNLISRVETLASSLPLHKSWHELTFNENDVANPSYQELKDALIKIRLANEDSRFVYVFTKLGDQVLFVVDSEYENSEDYSPPGQPYPEATDALKHMFEAGGTLIEGPVTDRWGTWVSALSFIQTDSPAPFVIGIDVNAGEYIVTPIIFAVIPGLIFLFIFFLIWIGSFIRSNEQKLIKMKSDFISIASHDLRAPLTGMRWSLENLLTNKTIDEDVKKKLDAMRITSVTLLELINELLDIKLIESDMLKTSKDEYCLLSDVVFEASNCQKLFADMKKITIKGDMDILPIQVRGESKRIYSVFNNIISNAVKYSEYGKEVILKTEIAPNKSYVNVSVIDFGIGIPKGDLSKIKQGFFRAENAKKYTSTGTGYGVYVSNLVLQAYGGHITIESEEGKGTKVIIRLAIKK
jgi:signal transduction histidine kinase